MEKTLTTPKKWKMPWGDDPEGSYYLIKRKHLRGVLFYAVERHIHDRMTLASPRTAEAHPFEFTVFASIY